MTHYMICQGTLTRILTAARRSSPPLRGKNPASLFRRTHGGAVDLPVTRIRTLTLVGGRAKGFRLGEGAAPPGDFANLAFLLVQPYAYMACLFTCGLGYVANTLLVGFLLSRTFVLS